MAYFIEMEILALINGHCVELAHEYERRSALLSDLHFAEANYRVGAFLNWVDSIALFHAEIDRIKRAVNADKILTDASYHKPPVISEPDEIIAIGIHIMGECKNDVLLLNISNKYGIRPSHSTNSFQEYSDAVKERYIDPVVEHLKNLIPPEEEIISPDVDPELIPREISESLSLFRRDFPDSSKVAFVMMQFGRTKAHDEIFQSICSSLNAHGITALRADSKEYHDDLLPNILTYIYGCSFGIAVFERIEQEHFNPNVSLEVGYMLALRKPICFLKDQSLKTLHADLIGKLYKAFDPFDPRSSIPPVVVKWLNDKGM